jgi:hypothetical protein
MNRYENLFEKYFDLNKKKKCNKLYLAIDIHETILKPNWKTEISKEFYPLAKSTLQLISKREDICMILWTSSLPHLCEEYLQFFIDNDIIFDYVNENPECADTDYADFHTKFYCQVGFDDKFGFLPEKDWADLFIYYFIIYFSA